VRGFGSFLFTAFRVRISPAGSDARKEASAGSDLSYGFSRFSW